MKQILIISYLLIFFSCTGIKELPVAVVAYPNWISSRPISNGFYIGIAKSSKANSDYRAIAKQSALLDLSSEISVKLRSESIFHQVDKGDSYREDYQSLIQIENQKNLEGYTLVSTWENDTEYWLYYEMSKSDWKKIIDERRKKAIFEAYSYYKSAEKYLSEQNIISAVHYAVKSLDVLKLYMNASLIHPEFETPLDVLCFQFLVDVHSSVDFVLVNGKVNRELILMGSDISSESFDVFVGKKNVPFKIRSSLTGVPSRILTDESGYLKVQANSLDVYKKQHFVEFILDWKEVLNNSVWLLPLLDLPEKSIKINLNILWPKISVNSTELNLGDTMSQPILLNETINYLNGKGFELVDEKNADLIIFISANTKEGLTNNTIHTSMLAYEFLVNETSGKVIYQHQNRAIKGVQASFETAGINAYERSIDDFKWDVLRGFLKYLEGK